MSTTTGAATSIQSVLRRSSCSLTGEARRSPKTLPVQLVNCPWDPEAEPVLWQRSSCAASLAGSSSPREEQAQKDGQQKTDGRSVSILSLFLSFSAWMRLAAPSGQVHAEPCISTGSPTMFNGAATCDGLNKGHQMYGIGFSRPPRPVARPGSVQRGLQEQGKALPDQGAAPRLGHSSVFLATNDFLQTTHAHQARKQRFQQVRRAAVQHHKHISTPSLERNSSAIGSSRKTWKLFTSSSVSLQEAPSTKTSPFLETLAGTSWLATKLPGSNVSCVLDRLSLLVYLLC